MNARQMVSVTAVNTGSMRLALMTGSVLRSTDFSRATRKREDVSPPTTGDATQPMLV